ncbi:AfsR/SARP family transcriptional regulator [Arthrobacter sp. CAL618]|uniref:AfsR/SARP family transcriptional regulator n=1 Tax=Arthrobacter sp. CAL618 TaxID=1055770 RepID=UPI001ED9BE8E|nr:bacterial transcriptional activator domain-containing protein [Arthrobacter sp. CAL618]
MNREFVDLDIDHFASLMSAAHRSTQPAEAYELLCSALSLNHSPLLGDELRPSWAEEERALHQARTTEACVLAAETATFLGKTTESVGWAKKALDSDQLNERAWTALILALEHDAQFAEGLLCYEQCRQTFARELGCNPGSILLDAHARLLRATSAQENELGPLLSALLILHRQFSQMSNPEDAGMSHTAFSGQNALHTADVLEATEIIHSFLIRVVPAP